MLDSGKELGLEIHLHLFSKVVNVKRGIWKFDVRAEVNDELACSATIMCADTPA